MKANNVMDGLKRKKPTLKRNIGVAVDEDTYCQWKAVSIYFKEHGFSITENLRKTIKEELDALEDLMNEHIEKQTKA